MAQPYPINIPSLRTTFPDVPNILNGLDLNVATQAGHPVNAEVRRNAKLVATAVKLQFGEFDTPLVSQ